MPSSIKKILYILLYIGLSSQVQAKPQLVFDVISGRILSGNDIDQQWYPASLTKIMTGYLAFIAMDEHSGLTLKSKITLSKNAASQPPSKLGIGAGNSITLDKALQALFTRSTNDIAVGIAEKISGSEAKFIKLMNKTAHQLGMSRTHFSNPHGLFDKQQVSTARDIAKLTHVILNEFPQYKRFYNMPYLQIGKRRLRNRNALLRNYRGANGLKTGFVCSSGYNLVATAKRGNHLIAAILLGGKSVKTRDDQVAKLLDVGFDDLATNKNINLGTIYNAQKQSYKSAFDMRPIACAPRKKK